jgi:DNA invertase Pin-like site-specific DNA recombinase
MLVLQDDGVSAFKVPISERPAGRRLWELIEEGRVEAIYVDAQDRLHRGDELEWVTFRALCASQGTAIVVDGQELGNDLGGKLLGFMRALFANAESVDKAHRVSGGKRVSASRGRRNGGPRPYGYTQAGGALTPVPEEFAVLRRARLKVVDDGLSQSDLARWANDAGICTANGKRWSQTRWGQTLRNDLYIGRVRHLDQWFDGCHEPVFTRAEWDELRRVQAARRRGAAGGRGGRPTKGSHVLIGGMLRCACGAAMAPRTNETPKGRVYEQYRCLGAHSGSTACTRPAVDRDLVDGALAAYFDRAGLADLEATRRAFEEQAEHDLAHVRALGSSARRRAAEKDAALERVRRDYAAGELPVADWLSLRDELGAERAEALAEAERSERREAEVAADADAVDAEGEALRLLAEVRAALTGPVRNAETLAAIRLRLYDHFVITERAPEVAIGPQPSGAGSYWLRPVLAEHAFDRLVATKQGPTALGQQPTASRRRLSTLLAEPIRGQQQRLHGRSGRDREAGGRGNGRLHARTRRDEGAARARDRARSRPRSLSGRPRRPPLSRSSNSRIGFS